MSTIPITVFTGFLGSGKTTIILDLVQKMQKLKPDYKIVLLKNEFGDIKVDSQIASAQNIQVTELINGCLCCVLVGQLKASLVEITERFSPDRIIVETSGSAFPAPIAWQVRQLPQFSLDAIITVIDCVNFTGYEDTSYTAKMQAQYTDLILLNKWELVSERECDIVIDHVNTLNVDTPKVKFVVKDGADPKLMFGIDTKLFLDYVHTENENEDHHDNEVDIIQVFNDDFVCSTSDLDSFLSGLSKEDVYRVKGFVVLSDCSKVSILNWAFGRYTLTEVDQKVKTQLTVMGLDLYMYLERFKVFFGGNCTLHRANRH